VLDDRVRVQRGQERSKELPAETTNQAQLTATDASKADDAAQSRATAASQVKTMKTRTLNSPSVMVLITKRLKVRVRQQHTCITPSSMRAVQHNRKQRQKVKSRHLSCE